MTRTQQPERHVALAVVAGVNALAAWAGAIGLVTGVLSLTAELNERLPFASPVVGGLALATIVAAPLTILTWWASVGDARAPRAAETCGVALVGWICVQMLILRTLSFFHPFYLAIGVVLIAWGRRLDRRHFPA